MPVLNSYGAWRDKDTLWWIGVLTKCFGSALLSGQNKFRYLISNDFHIFLLLVLALGHGTGQCTQASLALWEDWWNTCLLHTGRNTLKLGRYATGCACFLGLPNWCWAIVVRTLETVAIRTHRQEANCRFSKTKLGNASRNRRRPRQCVRKKKSAKLVCLDSACFDLQLKRLAQQPPALPQPPHADIGQVHVFGMPFAAACRTVQLNS